VAWANCHSPTSTSTCAISSSSAGAACIARALAWKALKVASRVSPTAWQICASIA
jgi:hypothetical protein